MAHGNPVPKLYKSVIEDVIEGVRELFGEEGIEEQVLKDLKQLWETKVIQSKATEGFFRPSHHSPQFTVHLPHSFHRALQASAASLVIPAGRGFQHFTAADLCSVVDKEAEVLLREYQLLENLFDTTSLCFLLTAIQKLESAESRLLLQLGNASISLAWRQHYLRGLQVIQKQGASQPSAAVALPSGVAYPLHVPAGVTLQTACGHLYKVNVPVMVAQASGEARVLQHPIQILQQLGQPAVVQAGVACVAQGQAAAGTLQPPEPAVRPTAALQPGGMEGKRMESASNAMLLQQQTAANVTSSQQADLAEKPQYSNLHTAGFLPEASAACSAAEPLASNPTNPLPAVEGHLDPAAPALLRQQVPDDLLELLIMGSSPDRDAVLKEQSIAALAGKVESAGQMEPNLCPRKAICSDTESIIQLDGADDFSPKEETAHTKDTEENEFIGFIESEDLKVLEDEDEEEDEEGDSLSNTESSSGSGDNEEPQIDVVEEDPLNSGDDVSEQDTPDLFDTDNVIVCQYDKIHRSKNKWKFYLKDGVMCFAGKDYVFAKAIGDAEW